MRTFRLVVTAAALGAVSVSLIAGLTSGEGNGFHSDGWFLENLPFVLVVVALTAVSALLAQARRG